MANNLSFDKGLFAFLVVERLIAYIGLLALCNSMEYISTVW